MALEFFSDTNSVPGQKMCIFGVVDQSEYNSIFKGLTGHGKYVNARAFIVNSEHIISKIYKNYRKLFRFSIVI